MELQPRDATRTGYPAWEALVAPLLTEQLRARRKGKAGVKWHADETYIKVHGVWCCLYRAIDADGNLVDSMLSERRDMDAARRFFARSPQTKGTIVSARSVPSGSLVAATR